MGEVEGKEGAWGCRARAVDMLKDAVAVMILARHSVRPVYEFSLLLIEDVERLDGAAHHRVIIFQLSKSSIRKFTIIAAARVISLL